MTKGKTVAIGLVALGIAAVLGGGAAFAQSGGDASLADKLAARFNLSKEEVQQVIDQHHTDRRAEKNERYEERLQKAVDDNKITTEQRDKILAKHQELQEYFESQRDAMIDQTTEERRDAMKAKMDELKQWEKDNNIPHGYLHPFDGLGKGHGMSHGRGMMGGGPNGQIPVEEPQVQAN
ncbi:hypothetical protein IT415_03605 [bacterium]|nr:hypothetical protein [bacterium]